MNTEPRKLSPAVISIIVVAMIAIISGAVYTVTNNNTSTTEASTGTSSASTVTDTSSSSSSSSANSNTEDPTSSTSSNYKDGTYSDTASYYTPDGSEDIKVTLVIANGTVTSASIENSGNDRESAMYQQRFAASYTSYVVGKSIDSLQLSRIAGASLTTDGFNSAIEAIRTDATA